MTDDVDDFLAHYGVKGMRWGVRKAQDGGSSSGPRDGAAYVSQRVAKGLVVTGAAQAGRILGASGGTIIAGPGLGTTIGGYAGGAAAAKLASRAVYGDVRGKKDAAKADLSGTLGKRDSKYSDRMAKGDIESWGPDGAQRINNSINSGMKRKAAVDKEAQLQRTASLVTAGAAVAQTFAVAMSISYLKSPKANAKIYDMAKKHGNARNAKKTGIKLAKAGRDGVYNVTSLK